MSVVGYRLVLRSYQILIGLFLILSFIGLIAFYTMFLSDTFILVLSIISLILGLLLIFLARRGVIVAPPILRFRDVR
jgi:multisubunit Na+/H+ antiporter MnhG subunit